MENFETGHFLGSLVMSTAQELRPVVIDGQQRLTTLMLLMSALRDECAARGMLKHAQRIDRRLIADDLADGDAYFKFKTGKANSFCVRVREPGAVGNTQPSEGYVDRPSGGRRP